MSIEIIRKVFEGSRALVSDRLMLLAIAEHADNDGVCWPSIDRLARWCNTSTRNATRLVNNLVAMGELRVDRCAGRNGVNLYRIQLQALTPLSPPDKAVTPDTRVTPTPDTQSIPPDKAVTTPLTPLSPKPSLNLQEPSEEPSEFRLSAGAQTPEAPAKSKSKRTSRAKSEPPTNAVWQAYSEAHAARYGTEPPRGQKVNGQLANLLKQISAEEAPAVAAHYVGRDDKFYVDACHPVDLLLRDCVKLRTQWKTGRIPEPALPSWRAAERERTAQGAPFAVERRGAGRTRQTGFAALDYDKGIFDD